MMIDGIKCPECGSENIAMVLYGMPAFDEELKAMIDAGDVVLHGCCINIDEPMYPYECKECGSRFDEKMAQRPAAKVYFSEEDYAWIENLSRYVGGGEMPEDYEPFTDDEPLALECLILARMILAGHVREFEHQLERDFALTYRRYANATFSRLVVLGLEYGAACKDGACASCWMIRWVGCRRCFSPMRRWVNRGRVHQGTQIGRYGLQAT